MCLKEKELLVMKKKKIISIISAILIAAAATESLDISVKASDSVGQVMQESSEEASASEEFADAINGESLVYSIKSLNNKESLNFTYAIIVQNRLNNFTNE